MPKESFVATSTAVALFVDGARLPVYLATEWADLMRVWPYLVVLSAGVLVGTVVGTRALDRIPQQTFRKVIGALLVALGAYMIVWGRG